MRVLRWQARAAAGRLDDARPGPEQAAHALLGWEREAICKLAEERGEVDQSHRKLAHRGSRLAVVHASESTVLRVLAGAGIHVPSAPPREPRPARPWPEWAELVPGVIWIYDFTHFTRAKRCAVAVLDVVSRYWLATVVSAEESSTQVEVAFTRALIAGGKEQLLDDDLLAELASGEIPEGDDRLPMLVALSDNGPQMTSKATAAFMVGARVAQHFGRPSTPNDQAPGRKKTPAAPPKACPRKPAAAGARPSQTSPPRRHNAAPAVTGSPATPPPVNVSGNGHSTAARQRQHARKSPLLTKRDRKETRRPPGGA